MRVRNWQGIAALAATVALLTATACKPDDGRAQSPASGALLEPYAPMVRYDSREQFFATAVAALAEHPDSALRHGPSGEVIATAGGEPERLSLDFLAAQQYADGRTVSRDDTITVAADYGAWARRLGDLQAHDDIVYGRAVQGSDERTWLVYWFFYVFNDSVPELGDTLPGAIGDHEGDWEAVAIKLDAAGETPELVVFTQHTGAEPRPWDRVEKVDGHPVLYPARGTHAGMFADGCHFLKSGLWPDCNDGEGRQVTPMLLTFEEPWATWPGKWGTIDAPSTRAHWNDPALID